MSPPNQILESEPYNRPWYVVHSRRRWNRTRSAKDDGEVDELEEVVWPSSRDEVDGKWTECSDEEEE